MIDDFGVMTKNECQGQIVYDIDFCVRVCSLKEDEHCSTNPAFGDDLCSIGTKCSHESSICERLPMVSDCESFYMSHTLEQLTVVYHMMCWKVLIFVRNWIYMFSRIKFKTEGEYDDSYDYSMSSSEFDQDLNQFMNLLDYTVSSYK